MKRAKSLLRALVVACAFLYAARSGWSETFTENFDTSNYKDPASTTAVWDTVLGETYLPSTYIFSQPAGLMNWGGEVLAIHYDGNVYLLGGKAAKLNRYNGSSWVNLAPDLVNFNNASINSIWQSGGTWLIGGSGKTLNSYNGSSFTDQAVQLSNWTTQDINAVRYGGGSTENFWLIAGNGGRLNRYNGSSFTDLAGSVNYFANTTSALSIGFDGAAWLIGGDGGSLCRYQNGNFSYLNPGFGSTGLIYTVASAGTNNWMLGGIGTRKLVSYNGTSFTDQSSNVPSLVTIRSIEHNGSFWIIAGNGVGTSPVVYSYDGSNWRNESGSMEGFGGNNPIFAVEWGAGEWLMGGKQTKLNRRTGTAGSPIYADLSTSLLDMGVEIINTVELGGASGIMLGGNNATLNYYNGSGFADKSAVLSGAGWGTSNVLCTGWNGTYWLIGGSSAKLIRYNGVSATDLTSALGFTGSVTSIHWDGSNWLIGGTNRQLAGYDGSSFAPLDLTGVFGATESVNAISSGGGVWVLGGSTGSMAVYDGVSFSGLTSGFTAVNAIGYAYYQSTSHRFLVGGASSPQQIRVYDLDLGWLSWYTLKNFTSSTVKTIDYCPSQQYWFVGGTGARLNSFDWSETSDFSSQLVNFGRSDLNSLTWNGEYWLLGGGEARLNKYGPVYEQPRWAQSVVVAGNPLGFDSVMLTSDETIPANTHINYWVTANGQLTDPHSFWVQATPGVTTSFSGGFEGPLLKWKAELTTLDTSLSPRLSRVSLNFVIPPTQTCTHSPTETSTRTPTLTPSRTATPTITATPSISATATPTPSISPTPTVVIFSPTITLTLTITPTVTFTSTSTITATQTLTSTETPYFSATPTETITATQVWTFSPTPTPNPLLPFSPGSLIIPMDIKTGRTNQNYAMFRAYGLVYRLLLEGIPVSWSIVSPAGHYKYYEEDDFICSQTTDMVGNTFTSIAAKYSKGAVYTNPSYNGGPFLIAAANSTAAMSIINQWNFRYGGNQAVMVHQYTGTGNFSANVYRTLRAAPKMAIFETYQGSPNGDIVCYNYLNNARMVSNQVGVKWWSSTDTATQWSRSSPDTFTALELAGTGSGGVGGVEGDHHDGALFYAGHGLPKYSVLLAGHWDGPATTAERAEMIAEVETFLHYPSVHFFAQCIAVNTFENDIIRTSPSTYGGHGHFLSTAGLTYTGNNITSTANVIAHYPVAQAVGRWGPGLDGAQTGYGYATGSIPWGGDSTAVHIRSTNWVTPTTVPTPYNTTANMYMSNWAWGNSAYGKISYLCTHDSNASSYPYSSNVEGVGARYFYNCLFESPAVSLNVPEMYLTLSAPGTREVGEQITYTVTYQNLSGIAHEVVLTLPDPAHASYQSSTGGGLHGAGSVTWNLGTLDVNATAVFTATYLTADSAPDLFWDAQANVVYKSGQTIFNASSNLVHTLQVVYTPTVTVTPSGTRTQTWTPTSTFTPSITPSSTQTTTATSSPTDTQTLTVTQTPTITETSTITPTSTETSVFTPTPTGSITQTSTVTPTGTWTPTHTPTMTRTLTSTITRTYTMTPTQTVTRTLTETQTITLTVTITPTPSITPTPTLTSTLTVTPSPPPAYTRTATPTLTQIPAFGTVLVYPNPFIPEQAQGKALKFDHLPLQAEVRIFTVTGELVWKQTAPGSRLTWDGNNQEGSEAATGVYLYSITFDNTEKMKGKIFLIR